MVQRIIALSVLLSFLAAGAVSANRKFLYIHEKGVKHFGLLLPMVNMFYFDPKPDYAAVGSPGFGVSLGYCYKENRFIVAEAGGSIKALLAERGKDTGFFHNETVMSGYIALRHHHIIGRVDLGYGPGYSIHNLKRGYHDEALDLDSAMIYYSNQAVGGSFSANCRVFYWLYAGVLYNPQFLSLVDGFKYEHTINIVTIFRLPLSRRKAK